MSPDTPDVTPTDVAAQTSATAPTQAPGDAAVPAAKRPRAPRKTAPKAEAAGAAEGVATEDGAQEAAPAPAPRKRTRKAVEAEGAPAGGEAGPSTAGAPAPEAADRPASAAPADRPSSASAEAAADRPVPAAADRPAPVAAAATPADTAPRESDDEGPARAPALARGHDDDGDDDETGVAGDGGADPAGEGEGEGEGRRSRSRRRRRGRRAGGAEDGAPEQVEGAAEAGAEEGAASARADRGPRPPRGPVVEFSTADAGETFAGVLSGAFDIDAEVVEGQPAIPAKRVLAAEPDAPKLHKVLAQSGIGSRRDMEQLIADGKVTVNGEVAHTGQRISFGDEVRVAGRVVKLRIAPPPARVIAYHKPSGEVVTMDDPEKRPTVFRRLPRLQHGKWQSVGRLDINTEGLLLFTNSGDLANKLMHPRFGVEREYAARVLGTLDPEAREKLVAGVTIDGQPAQFKSIEDGGGEGANRWYRVVITEGRNREVRKLFDAVGMAVSRLIRIRYGSVVLPKGLKRGVWVDLDDNDVRRLRQLAGAEEPQRVAQPAQGQPAPQARGERGDRPDRGQAPRGNGPAPKGRNRDRDRDRDRPRERDRVAASPAPFREPGDPSSIPNPLQQTFDRRAIQQRERPLAVADDMEDDGPIGPIPNPLQQTYDKRFVQGSRSPFGGKGKGGGKGGGAGAGGQKQPDPLQTAVGYIGADAFVKKLHGRGGGGGGGRGRR